MKLQIFLSTFTSFRALSNQSKFYGTKKKVLYTILHMIMVHVAIFSFIEVVIWLICSCNFAAVIDVILSWKARQTMPFYVKLRYILKVLSAAAWVIVLPVTYAYSWKNPPGLGQTIKKWFGNSPSSPSLFILAILIYLSPNMLSSLLFLFPLVRRLLERSNYKIVMLIMWWSQVYQSLFLS